MTEPRVVTFGCRLNAFESAVIRDHARDLGLTDTIVVNTCAVTGEAERQARQTIRRLRREHPGHAIIVTGCAAQLSPDRYAAMPEVDRVLGNTEKMDSRRLAGDDPIAVSDIMVADRVRPHELSGFEGRSRAFVQIQHGCDHRCTFCTIPFARGPNRSVAAVDVIAQVRRLVDEGYREIVLTGVDIVSWGAEAGEGARLGSLVRQILHAVPALPRLRLSTLDPAAVDPVLIETFAEDARLMPHVHLSLQAADDLVLKRMRRRHDRAQVFALARDLRRARPEMVFGADLIAGFPTETDAQFANTLAAVEDVGLIYLHVFPYSARAGTPAARMPQVPMAVRRARAARLRAAGDAERWRYFRGRPGHQTDALVERPREGRGRDFAPIRLGFDAPAGSIQPVRIVGADAGGLMGEAL